MTVKRQSPILPAVILALFFAMLVILMVSRKRETGTSPHQPATQNH